MTEEYVGVKFATKFVKKEKPINKNNENLIAYSKKLYSLNMMPDYGLGSSGNLSFRTEKGFIITPTATHTNNMSEDDLVEVLKVDLKKRKIKVIGIKKPSSECFMHWMIYNKMPEINAIFHGHWEKVIKNAKRYKIPSTEKELPYGTKKLGNSVLDILEKGKFIIMKNHGFVCVGKSMREAHDDIVNINNMVKFNF